MNFVGRLLLMSPEPETDRTTDRSGAERMERVEGVLASVHDTLVRLQKLGTQLEHEVARALYQDEAAGGSALATLELENSRLRRALDGRAVIEQAKGVIIGRTGGSEPDASGVLTDMARAEGIPVRDAAAAIVQAGRLPDEQTEPPPALRSTAWSPRDEAQLNPLNPINQVILADSDGSTPEPARRRWRPASPSHSSKRDAPRYRSSAF